MYKTFNNLVPIYITELIPPLTGDVSNNPLRNSNNIAIPFTRTEISHRSCIPSSITLWNSLDQNVRTIDSLKCFKNHIKNSYITNTDVLSFYLVGDRYFTILHARIRNNCSNLNNDIYVNNLRAKPLCSCLKENEAANHYFFKCVSYINQRVILFQTTRNFHPLNLDKLLFGDPTISVEENIFLFRAVQHFIKTSNTFTNN